MEKRTRTLGYVGQGKYMKGRANGVRNGTRMAAGLKTNGYRF